MKNFSVEKEIEENLKTYQELLDQHPQEASMIKDKYDRFLKSYDLKIREDKAKGRMKDKEVKDCTQPQQFELLEEWDVLWKGGTSPDLKLKKVRYGFLKIGDWCQFLRYMK